MAKKSRSRSRSAAGRASERRGSMSGLQTRYNHLPVLASITPDRLPAGLTHAIVACVTAGVLAGCEPRSTNMNVEPGGQISLAVSTAAANAKRRLADPRNDPVTLAWAMKELEPDRWHEGYARLVELAARSPRIAWHGEGTSIVPGRDSAPGEGGLFADLLGSTLVDAQDELWVAWQALERAGFTGAARRWLTEPPPWPPASIKRYLERDSETSMAMIETLAAELAPEPAVRAWLIRSWLRPARPVDGRLLAELAGAADGRLEREPRLRAWLVAEWTASARQRYRRVARLAGGLQPDRLAAETLGQDP